MSEKTLRIALLDRIDKKKWPDGAVLDREAIPFDSAYGDGPGPDAWHVRLTARSVYASMEDVKNYILSLHPDWPMASWSLVSGGRGWGGRSRRASGDGWSLDLDEATMAGIEREHWDTGIYMSVRSSFDVNVSWDDREWLAGIQADIRDGYLDRKKLRYFEVSRLAWLESRGPEYLSGVLSDDGYGNYVDALAALQAGHALSKAHKCAAWVSFGD